MASDAATTTATAPAKPAMILSELVAYTKKELDADAERQAKVAAAGIGGLETQTGATLDLSHRNIQSLPVEVLQLIKDRVERLALSHNPQIAVPSQIVQCDRLRYLNIRWNQLKYFPEAILQLSSLEILDLSKNRIVAIPEGIKNMTSLKFLAVARNKITRLPLALGEMASLSKLKFDENPIEFPPPEALRPQQNQVGSSIESEKDICQQVKRFLKAAALRERLRAYRDDELSESNAETPRPPRRTVTGGRFPIRPSMSGIDNVDDLKTRSPNEPPPPIPQRSHARDFSSNTQSVRRPGITPLLTGGNDISRSRSETVSSTASIRTRRQGFVPSKTRLDTHPAMQLGNGQVSVRSSQASTIRPTHSRANSSLSILNGFLTASSGGESSSGAVSPIEGSLGRFASVRRLSSLPENRNSKLQTSDAIRSAKRLLFSFFQLHGPISEVVRAVKYGTPKRTTLERQLSTANGHAEELDRLLNRLDSSLEDTSSNGKGEVQALNTIILTSVAALKAYGAVVKELRQQTQKVVSLTDTVYVRCLMSQMYMTMVESRNVCTILGFKTKVPAPGRTPRTSRAWSTSRTVTPTQAKPINNRRLRGATILRSMSSNGTLRSMPPPVPLNGNGSRTNTMTSVSTATPRSNEPFSTMSSSALSSRSNTMRSITDSDNDEQFDKIFLKLKSACDLAAKSLPHCRTEFAGRKDFADNAGHNRTAHHWALAINRCDIVIGANSMLLSRLKLIRVKDPVVRNQRDFWQLCDAFVQSWTDLATEIKDISQQRVDITTARTVMRPVQKAVKEVSKTISESPLYHQAVRPGGPLTAGLVPSGFPSNINTAFAQAVGHNNGHQSGYVTPMPATPLSAALGPAVQATVASTPTAMHAPPEYFQHGVLPGLPVPPGLGMRMPHERIDTVMQPLSHGRR